MEWWNWWMVIDPNIWTISVELWKNWRVSDIAKRWIQTGNSCQLTDYFELFCPAVFICSNRLPITHHNAKPTQTCVRLSLICAHQCTPSSMLNDYRYVQPVESQSTDQLIKLCVANEKQFTHTKKRMFKRIVSCLFFSFSLYK